MGFDRRMLGLLVFLAVIGLPAFALRVMCVGHSCDEPAEATASVPFCSLPGTLRSAVEAGFREGRSPDVLAVTTRDASVGGGDAFGRNDPQPGWPTTGPIDRTVPLAIGGAGLSEGTIPKGTGLDDIAPTIAALMGIERPHPEVRSGRAVAAVDATTAAPLVVTIVWKGVGSAELAEEPGAWPYLASVMDATVSTMSAEVPSLPLDPAATLTTIGTGGLPSQHGITGTLVRNDDGRVVEAWGPDAPVSVIAALGDDLDDLTDQRARIGLVAADPADRGLVGEAWYVASDRDDVATTPSPDAARAVATLLADGYGADDVPDLLAVTLDGSPREMDRATERILTTLGAEAPRAAYVVTATGSPVTFADLRGREVGDQVDSILSLRRSVVEAAAPGGLYLDQKVVARRELTEDEILGALGRVTDTASIEVFDQVFPAIAVSFGRYC